MRGRAGCAAVGACAALFLLSGTSHALPPPVSLVYTDPAGDANGLNSQGGLLPLDGGLTLPVNDASADILSVRFDRIDNRKVVNGIAITMTLAAAPEPGTLYRVAAHSASCSILWFELIKLSNGHDLAQLRHTCSGLQGAGGVVATLQTMPLKVRVHGSKICWILPSGAIAQTVGMTGVLNSSHAETRLVQSVGDSVLSTAPIIDQTEVQQISYHVGQ